MCLYVRVRVRVLVFVVQLSTIQKNLWQPDFMYTIYYILRQYAVADNIGIYTMRAHRNTLLTNYKSSATPTSMSTIASLDQMIDEWMNR